MKLDDTLKLNNCPHCLVDLPNLIRKQLFDTNSDENNEAQKWGLYVCQRCGGAILAVTYPPSDEIAETFPAIETVNLSLPEQVKRFLGQAIRSLTIPDASVVMSGSAVDAMLKEKGLEKGSVYVRINEAVQAGILTEEMGKWAHQIRLESNNPRHADKDSQPATLTDAKRSVEFAKVLGEFLFILPSKVEKGIQNSTEEEKKTPKLGKQPSKLPSDQAYRHGSYSKIIQLGKFDHKPEVKAKLMRSVHSLIKSIDNLQVYSQSGKPKYWETQLIIESCSNLADLTRIEIIVDGQTEFIGELRVTSSPK